MRPELLADNLLAALTRGGEALQPVPPDVAEHRRLCKRLIPTLRATERFALDAEATVAATVLAMESPQVLDAIVRLILGRRERCFVEWDNVAALGVHGLEPAIDSSLRSGAMIEALPGLTSRLLITPVGEIVEPHTGVHAGAHIPPFSFLLGPAGIAGGPEDDAARVLAVARLAAPMPAVLFGSVYEREARAAGQGAALDALAARGALALNPHTGAAFRALLAEPSRATLIAANGKRVRATNKDYCQVAFGQALMEFSGDLRRTFGALALLCAGAEDVIVGPAQRRAPSRLVAGRLVPYLAGRVVTAAGPGRAAAERIAARLRGGAAG